MVDRQGELRRDQYEGELLLDVRGLYAGYGGVDVLHSLSLDVRPREIVCIVGPNGSGKSTVFKSIYGLIPVRQGDILLGDRSITGMSPRELIDLQVAIVPQRSSIFPGMTVSENLELGLFTERSKTLTRQRIEEVFDLFPILANRRKQIAGTLSGGERRTVEIARGLMLKPILMLMDEPSIGLSPTLVQDLLGQVKRLREESNLTFLIIEQNARTGLGISDRGYVLENGRVTFAGTGGELLSSEEVQKSFLGGA